MHITVSHKISASKTPRKNNNLLVHLFSKACDDIILFVNLNLQKMKLYTTSNIDIVVFIIKLLIY